MTKARVLRLGRGFDLPLDIVTEATAIVATRGAGKSSASAVLVEETFALGVQSVILDRTGVYWGLRSNASGKGDGLGIYVLGGPHGDVPLEATAGGLIADLVVDSGHSFVLDFSDLSKAATVKFAADFLERLYDRKARSRSTTLVVMDEAHFYAPQTPRGGFKGDAARLMGAMEDVVGLGRSRGLGVVLTTQRTQALNKAVLDLIETLLVMRMLSPRARDAVRGWIQEKHEDDEQGVIPTLDSLPTGTAWVWAPLRGILERVALRRIRTFDSYLTPPPGETLAEPTRRRNLDLNELGEQMRATAERVKADDPKELRAQIRELDGKVGDLERELAERPEPEPVDPEVVWPFDDDEVERAVESAEGALARAREAAERAEQVTRDASNAQAGLAQLLADLRTWQERRDDAAKSLDTLIVRPPARAATGAPAPTGATAQGSRRQRARPSVAAGPPTPPPPSANGQPDVPPGAWRILDRTASRYPLRFTRAQVARLSDYSVKGGAFIAAFKATLRAGWLVETGGEVEVTAAGLEAWGGQVPDPPRTEDEALDMWRSVLDESEAKIFDALRAAEGVLSRDELAEVTGYTASGGRFSGLIGVLVRNGLAERNGDLVCLTDRAMATA